MAKVREQSKNKNLEQSNKQKHKSNSKIVHNDPKLRPFKIVLNRLLPAEITSIIRNTRKGEFGKEPQTVCAENKSVQLYSNANGILADSNGKSVSNSTRSNSKKKNKSTYKKENDENISTVGKTKKTGKKSGVLPNEIAALKTTKVAEPKVPKRIQSTNKKRNNDEIVVAMKEEVPKQKLQGTQSKTPKCHPVINENSALTIGTASPLQFNCVSPKKYNLRKKESSEKAVKEPTIKKNIVTIAKRDASLSVTALFNICKRKSFSNLLVGEIVLAKMRSYSPWPAKIMKINAKKANVYFFGTNNHGDVNLSECVPVSECGAVISKLLDSKQADYRKAVCEMKTIMELTGMPIIE